MSPSFVLLQAPSVSAASASKTFRDFMIESPIIFERKTALPVKGNEQATAAAGSVIPLRFGGLVLAALGIFPLAAVIKYAPVLEWLPVAAKEWLISVLLLVSVCVVIAAVAGDHTDRFISRARRALLATSPREFAAWVALFVLSASLALSWYCFNGVPTSADEMTQRFQANMLLHGRLWVHTEPHFEFFSSVQSVNRDGRWLAQFPIGGALILALGAIVNVPWLVNPVLAAWTASSVYRFTSQVSDDTSARAATLLFALSPFVLLMSASQMNHVGTLALIMFAVAALPEWATSEDARRVHRAAAFIGLGIAGAAAIRPYDAFLVAVAVG